jgi:integrase
MPSNSAHILAIAAREPPISGCPVVTTTLLALTFVRPGTQLQAEWEEFDLDKALWTIPFKKLKQRKFREGIKELTSKPHFVPLSRQALAPYLANGHSVLGILNGPRPPKRKELIVDGVASSTDLTPFDPIRLRSQPRYGSARSPLDLEAP